LASLIVKSLFRGFNDILLPGGHESSLGDQLGNFYVERNAKNQIERKRDAK
jgi:hypothetical protein